jgi:hypothetical protein
MSNKNTCPLIRLKNGVLIDSSKVSMMRITDDYGIQAWYLIEGIQVAVSHESHQDAENEIKAVNQQRIYFIDPAKEARDRLIRTSI